MIEYFIIGFLCGVIGGLGISLKYIEIHIGRVKNMLNNKNGELNGIIKSLMGDKAVRELLANNISYAAGQALPQITKALTGKIGEIGKGFLKASNARNGKADKQSQKLVVNHFLEQGNIEGIPLKTITDQLGVTELIQKHPETAFYIMERFAPQIFNRLGNISEPTNNLVGGVDNG